MNDVLPFTSLFNALTLWERIAIEQAADQTASGQSLPGPSAATQANKRLRRWKAQRPFNNPALFKQRLAQDGLDRKQFKRILGRNADDYAAAVATNVVTLPAWAEPLARLFEAVGDFGDFGDSKQTDGAQAQVGEEAGEKGFLRAFVPLIAAARKGVHQKLVELLANLAENPITDLAALEGMLYGMVRKSLEEMVTPTLVLEMNIARLRGELVGDTAEERFEDYCSQLNRPERIRPLLEEYPLLFRLVAERLDLWQRVSVELVERLCADWQAVYDTFAPERQPAPLQRLAGAQGSTKRGGRSVIIFEFTDGLKVVYKPRSLAAEAHFQPLLGWLHDTGYPLDFRPLKLLDRTTHGWVEWLDTAECASEAEVERFYQRQGAYLALLYALEATDFHLSNIIAVGEYPVLIDLEALFHPRDADPDWPALELALDNATYHSVLRLGLLPEPELGEDETAAPLDESGMGGIAGQLTPDASPTWEDKGLDTMRLVHKRRRIKGGKNLPVLNGRPALAVDYAQAIEQGFITMYRLLVEKREALLAADSPLAPFAAVEVRVLPRSGRSYGRLLSQSFHPDLMRDALERDRFFDQLWQDAEEEPPIARLIPHERDDLLRGDIPLFATYAASQTAYSSSGRPIPDFFPRSGLEASLERIASLDEADLEHQRWFIRASLATVVEEQESGIGDNAGAGEQGSGGAEEWGRLESGKALDGGAFLEEARRIGEWLEARVIRAEGEADWLGLELADGRHWQIEPLDTDLRDGLPGTALFLAHLGVLTGEVRWTELARAAIATVARLLAEEYEGEELDTLSPIGALNGLGGQLYALAHLGTLWQDEALLRAAERYVEAADLLLEEIAEDEEVGLAEGLAGLLAGLLAVYQVTPSPRTLQVAQQAAEEVLDHLDGEQADVPDVPLADFLYGRAGTAWTLATLAAIGGKERFQPEPALLAGDATPGLLMAWLRALPWLRLGDEAEAVGEGIGQAVAAVAAEAFAGNHSLFEGIMGYVELLLQAAVVLDDVGLHGLAERYGTAVLADVQQHGWRCATPLNVETPGLMAGLAGIGYTLLRLSAAERVPSLLALELPISRQ